jgi:hypothetical protein
MNDSGETSRAEAKPGDDNSLTEIQNSDGVKQSREVSLSPGATNFIKGRLGMFQPFTNPESLWPAFWWQRSTASPDISMNSSISTLNNVPLGFNSSPVFWKNGSPASFKTAHSTMSSPASWMTASPASWMTASPASWVTASPASFMTASPGLAYIQSTGYLATVPEEKEPRKSDFQSLIIAKGLVLPIDLELDWSGRGQHVEYTTENDVPLVLVGAIAATPKALIEKVRCRRIILARKTMRCSRGWTIDDALVEVEHLNRLRHAHIIQLVGSYLCRRSFSILLYPVAHWDLARFLDDLQYLPRSDEQLARMTSLSQSLTCLLHTLAYIHERSTKHMDIKPANILVKSDFTTGREPSYRFYLSDFGISRNFEDLGYSQTDRPTARSAKYCAPEVSDQDIRGRAADVFSLGCVFAEILTVLAGKTLEKFEDFRCDNSPNGARAFHASIEATKTWLKTLHLGHYEGPSTESGSASATELKDLVKSMLRKEPAKRPTAERAYWILYGSHDRKPCCLGRPEPYVID